MRLSFVALSILLAYVAGISAAEIKEKLNEDKSAKSEDKEKEAPKHTEFQELDIKDIDEDKEDDEEVKRKKKSTTTTFCVEIRPSGDQKPFQVCEPGYAAPGAQPHYSSSASSYGQEPQNPHEALYQAAAAASQSKPAAAYSGPVKTFPTSPASKPYTPHSSYGSYRSNDDMEADDGLMNTNHLDSEEDGSTEDSNLRSAYGNSHYMNHHDSHLFGAPKDGYVPTASEPKTLHHHNGLVITCQPNLAGYAHNIPNYGHASAVPSYNYRAASGRYGRPYQPYRPQQQPYGSYQHLPKPVSRPAAYNQALAIPAFPAPTTSSGYSHAQSAYSHAQTSYGQQSAPFRQPAFANGYKAPAATTYSQRPTAPQLNTYGSSSQVSAQPQTYGNAMQGPVQAQTYGSSSQVPTQPQAYGSSNQVPVQSHTYGSLNQVPVQSQAYGSTNQVPVQAQTYGSLNQAPVQSQTYGSSSQVPVQAQTYGSSSQVPVQAQTYGSSSQVPVQAQTYGSSSQDSTQQQAYDSSSHQQHYATSAQSQTYTAPAQQQAQAPAHSASAYQTSAAQMYQAPAPAAPVFQDPAAKPPVFTAPAPAGPAQAFSQSPASYSSSSYVAPGYVAPATYRDAEANDQQLTTNMDKNEKESHTMKKMEKISEQRASGSRWGEEMASDNKSMKDEQMRASGAWREADGEQKLNDNDKVRDNEVDETM